MKTSELLIDAKALISAPETWTKGTSARDEHGRPVYPTHIKATCFCSVGALIRKTGNPSDENYENYQNALGALQEAFDPKRSYGIVYFNDNRTHAEVMAVWDQAIAERIANND